jgi:phage terminase large subunit
MNTNENLALKVDIKDLIAPNFYDLHRDIKNNKYTHYMLKGGRGSTKSSFIGIEIPFNMMKDFQNGILSNALILRKLENTLRGSVYQQILWAIDILGVSHLWHCSLSPLSCTYLPSGQKIIFMGADNPKKIKSTKFKVGYCKYTWYEELDEFQGMETIRIINQSTMRGGEKFITFYSYNPPKSVNNWVNIEATKHRDDRIIHLSDYTTVPKEWLGETFLYEAEQLRLTNEDAYKHEYKGEVTGTGGEIFTNIINSPISDEDIQGFYNVKRGIDWGYATDPLHYTENHFDATRRILYVYKEIHKNGLSNRKLVEEILTSGEYIFGQSIVCDSAEPKSIADLKEYGLRAIAAKKGQGSVEYGIKWLQDLEAIVIDNKRCPNTSREFLSYCLIPDGNGGFKNEYPDKDNHSIDAIRYCREDEVNARKIKFLK